MHAYGVAMTYFTRTRKYNSNHDPKNGEFTSGEGGSAQHIGSSAHDYLRTTMATALGKYDDRKKARGGHNLYAYGQYMERLGEVMADIKRGAPIRDAIVAGYSGRLAASLLKATKQRAYDPAEEQDRDPFKPYTPVVSVEEGPQPRNSKQQTFQF